MQTMLPTMLKIDAVKIAEPIALSAEEQARYFGQADSVAFNTLSDEDQVALMKLAQAEKVAISYVKKIAPGLNRFSTSFPNCQLSKLPQKSNKHAKMP